MAEQEYRNYSVNAVNFKYAFEDGHTCFLTKGKSLAAQEKYEDAICGLVSDHGSVKNETVISYLVWDKASAKDTPSCRIKASVFDRIVEAGHSFRAAMGDSGVMSHGVFCPDNFKVFKVEQKKVSYKSLQQGEVPPSQQ